MNQNSKLSEIWSQRTGDLFISNETLTEKIYDGLMPVLRESGHYHPDMFVPHLLTGQRRAHALNAHIYIRKSIETLFQDDMFGHQARRAFEMDEAALDFCCREIVDTFLPEERIDKDAFCDETVALAAQNTTPAIDQNTRANIRQALEDTFATYEKMRHRLIAGPVFGFITDAPDRDLIVNHYSNIIHGAINDGLGNNSLDR